VRNWRAEQACRRRGKQQRTVAQVRGRDREEL